jgi:hypothetical protein
LQSLIAARVADAQTFTQMAPVHSSTLRHTEARVGAASAHDDRARAGSDTELSAKLGEWGFVLPGEATSEREKVLFQQLIAKTSKKFAAGDVVMEAGSATRSLVFLISGVIVARRQRAAAADANKPGAWSWSGLCCGVMARQIKDRNVVAIPNGSMKMRHRAAERG